MHSLPISLSHQAEEPARQGTSAPPSLSIPACQILTHILIYTQSPPNPSPSTPKGHYTISEDPAPSSKSASPSPLSPLSSLPCYSPWEPRARSLPRQPRALCLRIVLETCELRAPAREVVELLVSARVSRGLRAEHGLGYLPMCSRPYACPKKTGAVCNCTCTYIVSRDHSKILRR